MKMELQLEKDDCIIEINGAKYNGVLEAKADVDYTRHAAQNMQGRMEDAIPASHEIEVEWAECELTLFSKDGTKEIAVLKFFGVDWLESLFGEIEEEHLDSDGMI